MELSCQLNTIFLIKLVLYNIKYFTSNDNILLEEQLYCTKTHKTSIGIKIHRKNMERRKSQICFRNPELSKAADLDSCNCFQLSPEMTGYY